MKIELNIYNNLFVGFIKVNILSKCVYNFYFFMIPQDLIDFRSRVFAQFKNSALNFARAGFATTPPEALATREATCRACPEWDASALNNTGRCRKCGCSTWAKLRMATEACPLGKWEAVDKTPE